MKKLIAGLGLVSLLAAGFAVAGNQTVYRTIGEDGSVTFSDAPPAHSEATELNIAFSTAVAEAADRERLREIRETTDRIVADRLARETHRANLRKLQAEAFAIARAANQATGHMGTAFETRRHANTGYGFPSLARDHGYTPFTHAPRTVRSASRPSLSEQLRQRTSTSAVYRERW